MGNSSVDIHEIDLKINSLSKDFEQIDRLCLKLTESIEKLQEVNISLTKIVVLHEEKHEQHQKNTDRNIVDLREIEHQIDAINRDIVTKFNLFEREHLAKINRENQPNLEISKFHWMLLGGALTLGWLLSNVNLVGLASLFK